MVNIASFWTQYRIGPLYRPSGSSQRCAVPTKHGLQHGHSLSLLPIGSSRPLQGRTKEGAFTDDACASNNACCAVTVGGAFPDDACASTKSRCAVSKNSEHIKLIGLSRVPSRQALDFYETHSTMVWPYTGPRDVSMVL